MLFKIRALNRGCKSNGGKTIGVTHQRFETQEDTIHIEEFVQTTGPALAGTVYYNLSVHIILTLYI